MKSDEIKNEIIKQIEQIKENNLKPGSIILDHLSFFLLLKNPITLTYYTSALNNGKDKIDMFLGLPIAKIETVQDKQFIKVYAKE